MKFYHLGDLHFGKIIYGLSMTESGDQKYWVEQFLSLCETERPDAVVIAGDVYDRSNPNAEAVRLLDEMLTGIAKLDIPVLMIAGNHDSGQKLEFGSSIFSRQNIHIAGKVQREMVKVPVKDEYGTVNFWLMPYMFAEEVSSVLEDDSVRTYAEAAAKLIAAQNIDPSERNVLVAHQNVTCNGKEAERSGSETMVGGVGGIDYKVFDVFDYVALGHIHSGYPVGRDTVRYSGTPLCYHFEEVKQKEKGPVEVTIGRKNDPISTRTVGIEPLHRMRVFRGTYDEILSQLNRDQGRDEYVSVVLTDRRLTPEINAYLQQILEGRGSLLLDRHSTFSEYRDAEHSASSEAVEEKAAEELFAQLYEDRTGEPVDEASYDLLRYIRTIAETSDFDNIPDTKDVNRIIQYALKNGGAGL